MGDQISGTASKHLLGKSWVADGSPGEMKAGGILDVKAGGYARKIDIWTVVFPGWMFNNLEL